MRWPARLACHVGDGDGGGYGQLLAVPSRDVVLCLPLWRGGAVTLRRRVGWRVAEWLRALAWRVELASARPVRDLDELRLDGLTDEESAAWVEAMGRE